ncbi:DUF1471 family protein YdgH [Morganella morganii]|uniref:DUF1471 family protein YdgH n=1 Tax=Morganella morganii TaxID=582 RepID=UPI001163247F|nr:DUF1471 family protein YdgH [Morganella morganii]QQO74241.1 DUF1471 domain-containing protein [Morganella morganii]
MKLKTTVIASAMFFSFTSLLPAQAAQELTPEQAEQYQPFERIAVTGRFNAIYEAAAAVSRKADKMGADAFYIQSLDDLNNNGNMRVVADVYHRDAPPAEEKGYRQFRGVNELPEKDAIGLQPFDTVTVSGFFANSPDLNDAIAKEAVKKDAASFFIVRNIFTNDGGNQLVTAYVYKADAPKRVLQTEEALIPADSDAGRAALAAGGEAAKQVEIPGVASSTDTAGNNVGRFFETQSSRSGRYTVTLPDGTQVQELNKASAAVMAPFDSVTFTGYYTTSPEVSYQVAKRAAAKGAKYYHITRQWQSSGGNVTISADLFK